MAWGDATARNGTLGLVTIDSILIGTAFKIRHVVDKITTDLAQRSSAANPTGNTWNCSCIATRGQHQRRRRSPWPGRGDQSCIRAAEDREKSRRFST